MIRRALLFALLGASAALAQSAIVSVSRRALLNGDVQLTLRNEYKSPVTAYVIGYRVALPSGRPVRLAVQQKDSILSGGAALIEPGTAITIDVSGDPWELHAVIFADGTVHGDYSWIERIMESRKKARGNARAETLEEQ